MVSLASSQYVLQYFSPSGTGQLHAGWAHCPSGFSGIGPSSLETVQFGFHVSLTITPIGSIRASVTDFLQNAERIFETAASADGVELESGTVSILISQEGAIRMVMGSDWPLGSLRQHYGSKAAYR